MVSIPKLTTVAACRVAGLDRDRFNEHVAAGRFGCAPSTVQGKARLFTPDDMIALCLFRELMDDGMDADTAGRIACEVSYAAKKNPDSAGITIVLRSGGPGWGAAYPSEEVPAPETWARQSFWGGQIRRVMTFNMTTLREEIAEKIEEERSIIGPAD